MRVLDVGTGVGDVAFLAAEFVGAGGEVLGVDRSFAAIATAVIANESVIVGRSEIGAWARV